MVLAVYAETRQTLCLHAFHALTLRADEIRSAVSVQERKAPLTPRKLTPQNLGVIGVLLEFFLKEGEQFVVRENKLFAISFCDAIGYILTKDHDSLVVFLLQNQPADC